MFDASPASSRSRTLNFVRFLHTIGQFNEMASASSAALRQIDVRPFGRNETLNRFTCGEQGIDRWLKNHARKHSDREECRVFLAFLDGEAFPVGYYALKVSDEKTNVFSETPDDYTKNLVSFGVVNLSFLGVHLDYQKQGIGRFLLADAIYRCYEILTHAGYYAFTLQSINSGSTAFYKKLNFVPYAGTSEKPKMMLLAQNIRKLVEST